MIDVLGYIACSLACVLTCWSYLRAYVLVCLARLSACLLTWLACLACWRYYVLAYLACLNAYVLVLPTFSSNYFFISFLLFTYGIVIIIVIIIIVDGSSKCWFDTIICQVFYLKTSGRRVASLTTWRKKYLVVIILLEIAVCLLTLRALFVICEQYLWILFKMSSLSKCFYILHKHWREKLLKCTKETLT